MLKHLFNFIVFPGFLFTAFMGLLASWVDRKVTARIQYRVGPPLAQPFLDIAKLSIKEVIISKSANKFMFMLSPFIGLSGAILASTFIWLANIEPGKTGFSGDIIVVLYLMMIPAIMLIIGGSSSGNPLASVGASREIKLVLAYELPFILSIIVPIIKTNGLLKISEIISFQSANNAFVLSFSGALSLVIAIFCMQAKLGLVPFDMSEAETEIMAGVHIEYSGMLLAILKLTKALMMVVVPIFLVSIFWGGFNFYNYLILLVVMILIKNTNPRVRIDQAIRFFWGKMTFMAILAIVLAKLGL